MMLTARHKDLAGRWLQPLAAAAARAGVPPSAITVGCPLLMAAACAWYVRTSQTPAFCIIALLIGLLDVLDGPVARAAGKVSRAGAYLDAMCDRYVDIMVVIAAAYVTGYWLLCAVVLAGALLVSYAKARAAMEVSVSNREWPDLMERIERSLLFLAGLAAGALLPWRPLGRDLFWWTLLALCVLIHATVLQRLLRALRYISERSPRR